MTKDEALALTVKVSEALLETAEEKGVPNDRAMAGLDALLGAVADQILKGGQYPGEVVACHTFLGAVCLAWLVHCPIQYADLTLDDVDVAKKFDVETLARKLFDA